MWEMKSLFDQALQCIEDDIVNKTEQLLQNDSSSFIDILEHQEKMYKQVQLLPGNCYSKVANRILSAALRLSACKFNNRPKHKISIENLISIATRLEPKKFSHGLYWNWVTQFKVDNSEKLKLFHAALYDRFKEMRQLEVLKCSVNPKNQRFIKNVPFLKNLISFTCPDATNEIVEIISNNCKLIQEFNLTFSKNVTDLCVKSLTGCEKLRKVQVCMTGVTNNGLVKLLIQTRSAKLVKIGYVNNLNNMLNLLEKKVVPFRAFPLKELLFHGRGIKTDISWIQMLTAFFPDLTVLKGTLCYEITELTPSFSAIDQLANNVKDLDVRVFISLGDPLNNFQHLNSSILTSLALEFYSDDLRPQEIKLTTIMQIGVQCPNITTLRIIAFSIIDDTRSAIFHELQGKSFLKLKDLSSYGCYNISCFKNILSHAFRIESINLFNVVGESMDNFFDLVLTHNPFERLERLVLASDGKNEISFHIVERVITHCKKLSTLGQFDTFDGLSEEQVQEIRNLIVKKGLKINMLFFEE